MKYLYQQLLAFGGLILLILLTLGLSFTQFTRKTLEDNNYKELLGYAESMEKNNNSLSRDIRFEGMSSNEIFQFAIGVTESSLNQQDVSFVFIDKDRNVQYPEKSGKVNQHLVSDEQWKALKVGQQQKETSSKNVMGQNQTTSYAMVPFFTNGEFFGVLLVSQPAMNVESSVNSIVTDLFKAFIIASIIAIIVSYFFATQQVKRINRMRSATKEVASGNFDVIVPNRNRDEFDDLADDFNQMTVSLKASQEEIERQEERRKQFMADASHEMRTPLTTINGLLEGLQYNAIPENQKEKAIKLMQNETSRLIRLVNENLDYEKIRTNQISVVLQKFNATEAVSTLVSQLHGKAEASGDELILQADAPIDVYADYDRFVQVLVNLIQNAIQFTTNGTITVAIKKLEKATEISIADTGIGMTENQVKNIWDRYYKADPSRKNTKYGESGLGLSIVQELVRLHNGTIEVVSALDKGTTFTVVFPDKPEDTDQNEEKKESSPA
ncbi:sensor histidine kinase [Enterococcus gilvus]|uniref:histidine kinase n=1 Tax=Enterococcus gilvus ATCC BAA-350 TaxID=1158614 RepID=R2Y1R6_9ENTE|nr:HAMP domain-containing sensor histidine kinase [Enterococcus gilvus]EOI56237.1 two-component system sensor histidine kinase [Enterococcus gilvus ATCC BAA-350]EOW82513.1 two-component system sensor histidine kinase [Enterococcus gilvus ATCC BAA-350]